MSDPGQVEEEEGPRPGEFWYVAPCLVCGATDFCGYDEEGRGLIHDGAEQAKGDDND